MKIFDAMLPMAFFLILGYGFSKLNLINEPVKKFLNKLLFYVGLPSLAFKSIVAYDFSDTFSINLILHNITFLTVFVVLGFLFSLLINNRKQRGAIFQACFRNNQGYIGLHLAENVYGPLAVSKASVVNGFEIPFVNIFAIIGLEILREVKDNKGTKEKIKNTLINIIKNPFVICIPLAMILSAAKVDVLGVSSINMLLNMAGGFALPIALILIGGSITFKYLKENIVLVTVISLLRLLIVPVLAYFAGIYIFKLSGLDLSIGVTLLSTPTAVSSYVFAREMGADEKLMASFIGVSTMMSIITIPIINILLNL